MCSPQSIQACSFLPKPYERFCPIYPCGQSLPLEGALWMLEFAQPCYTDQHCGISTTFLGFFFTPVFGCLSLCSYIKHQQCGIPGIFLFSFLPMYTNLYLWYSKLELMHANTTGMHFPITHISIFWLLWENLERLSTKYENYKNYWYMRLNGYGISWETKGPNSARERHESKEKKNGISMYLKSSVLHAHCFKIWTFKGFGSSKNSSALNSE